MLGKPFRLVMHFCYQRTGGVQGFQRQLRRFRMHRRAHSVGGKNHMRTLRHLIGLLHKNRTPLRERLHHIPVVHNFLADIDRGTIFF